MRRRDLLARDALLIAVPMAVPGVMLLRRGIETRGHRLDEIQDALARMTTGR